VDETKKTKKPNCYECIHRGSLPGDAHSRCNHPSIGLTDPLEELLALFASVRRESPVIKQDVADKLGIKADYHGIKNGWFNWPYNFDPMWLVECKGHTLKGK